MNQDRNSCRNMNHTRSHPPIRFCPSCGERFKTTAGASCDNEKHRIRRKERDHFCHDCGKDLSK